MNSTPKIPGYEVIANDPTGQSRTITRTFIHPVLLTARQNALQFVQELMSNQQRTHALDVTANLVEMDRTRLPASNETICTVFNQRFGPNLIIPQGKPKQIAMNVDADCPLPSSVSLTLDLTKDNETFNSPKAIWSSLGEISCECEYFRSQGFDSGFGYVVMNLEGPNKPLPEIKNLSALSDQQIDERLTTLRQPKPYSSFHLLYDAFPHAANLISNYNEHYASDEGLISFSLQFSA